MRNDDHRSAGRRRDWPGDYGACVDLLERAARAYDERLTFEPRRAGAACYADCGEALPEDTVRAAREADAILLGAMGMPNIRYPDGTEITPQIDLRLKLDLYAGVRPVKIVSARHSPLRRAEDINFVLVRENTEGLFASLGKGVVTDDDHATETLRISRRATERLFDFAFDLARKRSEENGLAWVTCVDKANVFRAFAFFRRVAEERAAAHKDIPFDTLYVDAAALKLVQTPAKFDVLVTENMFGDILSDLGAGLMGGLGLAPSADIGDDHAVFQPCHGSAPDIAGEGVANPTAMILSGAMMLDWLGVRKSVAGLRQAGAALERAVELALNDPSLEPTRVRWTAWVGRNRRRRRRQA